MKKIIIGILIGLGLTAGTVYAATVFRSDQVGSSPTNGKVLQTNGTTSTWVATSTLGFSSGAGTPTNGISGQFLGNSATNTPAWYTPGYFLTVCSAGCNYTATSTGAETGLQNAFNAAYINNGGGIFVKSGSYGQTTSTVNMASSTMLTGEGYGSQINASTSGTTVLYANNANNIVIQNMHFDAIRQATTTYGQIRVVATDNVQNFRLINNDITNCGNFCFVPENNSTTTQTKNILVMANYIQGTGHQDAIGGAVAGPDASTPYGSTTDVTVLGNFLSNNTYAGGIINNNMDANCIDLVGINGFNFSENNCHGQMIFGEEKTPNIFSKMTGNILAPPLGPVKVAAQIIVLARNDNPSPRGTSTNLTISGNVVQNGSILFEGNSTTYPIGYGLVSGNNVQTPDSSYQFQDSGNGIPLAGVREENVAHGNITENILVGRSTANTPGISLLGANYMTLLGNRIENFTTGINCSSAGNHNKVIFNDIFNSATPYNANCTNIISMDDNGSVSIGTGTASSRLTVQGVGTSSANSIFTLASSSGSSLFSVDGAGNISDANLLYLAGANQLILSGANTIVQTSPTSSAIFGNLIQSGGVQSIAQTTYLSATQFCSGGLFYVASTTNINIYFPTLTQQGTAPCGNTQPWASQFAQQFAVNGGSGTYTVNASGSGESLLYAMGSGATIYPGQSQFAQGQFTASSTIQGATTTGMSFQAYLATFQPRPTAPSVQGQFLMASTTGSVNEWVVGQLEAGSGVTLSTSTPGKIIITSTGGSGNSAWLFGNGLIYNATSTDSVLVGTTTPTTANFLIQGTGTKNPFTVTSSSGASFLTVVASGNVGIGTTSPSQLLTVGNNNQFTVNVASILNSPSTNILTVATSTGANLFNVNGFGNSFLAGLPFASSTTPTIATSTGAGSGGTASITGGNSWGEITVNALTSPGTSAVVVTITPTVTAPTKIICTFTPSNPNAEGLGNTTQIAATSTASTWGIVSNSSGLTTGTTYKWFYSCGGY